MLATYAGRLAPVGSAILIDIGSTTTDIVGLVDGVPVPTGRTDRTRLECGELVYCGVRRTPLCALFGLEKAAEFFATTEDVYLTLGDLPEEPHRTDTADGRPVTPGACASLGWLARMECADVGDGSVWLKPDRCGNAASSASDSDCLTAVKHVASKYLPSAGETGDRRACRGPVRFLIPSVLAEQNWDFGRLPARVRSTSPGLGIRGRLHALARRRPRGGVAVIVVKVGGSLYDLPDLGDRLRRFLAPLTGPVLLFPGGGITVDTIRELDRIHRLGEEASHWLALAACSVNGMMLARLLPGTPIVDEPEPSGVAGFLDPYRFAVADEALTRRRFLPHCWEDDENDSMARGPRRCFGARGTGVAEVGQLGLKRARLGRCVSRRALSIPSFPAAIAQGV